MSAKNKKLLAVLGAAAVVVIVIAAVLLGKGGQTTTVDPASTPSDVSAEDVDSSNTPDSSSSEPLVVVPDTSKPEATDSQNQTDAVLNVEEEDQVDVNLTDSEKKPETTPPPAPSQEEQQAASEKDEPIVHEVNFTKVCRRVESAFNIQKCKVRTLANLQKEGFQSISPTYPANSTVDSIVSRIIPMSTFVGGFPFASSGYNDGRGYYFAKDSNGGLVILDTWERGNDRTNSSFVIMGVAGIGKSTVVKHIMLSEYMKGTKILCIDPESEYKDMCRNLNGSWLNAGGGKNGRSNLLQIRPAPRDDDDETDKLYTDEGNGMSDMALHMKTLEIEFSLYLPSLTDMQKAILKQTIIELYNQFGIFWETDIRQLKATDFPILSDLHALLEKKAEANKENPVYRDLAMLLYDAAAGSDSFLWNGHTTLEANSRFICLDTHDLQNASDNVKRTQYLNLLSWCWEEMSRDRNERCLLVCDEAYLMIDPQVPQSLVFLRNVEKRARKYEAGLAIISHSVVDFLAPEVKMYGQALLDIPCYKILMGCDGKNLQETKDLYNLTDAEQELLESKRRGHALFIIGSKRLHVNFEIPAYKFSYMGKAGGR